MSATAQDSTNMPVVPPPPISRRPRPRRRRWSLIVALATNAPATSKKAFQEEGRRAQDRFTTETTVSLVPGPAEVGVSHLNVRGQAGMKGEVISHLTKGEPVERAEPDSRWTSTRPMSLRSGPKISLPATGSGVWVRTQFIDGSTEDGVAEEIESARAGPGENYSVLGVIEHGAVVTETEVKGDWTKIEVPTNAHAFVAAMYLKQEASGTMPTNSFAFERRWLSRRRRHRVAVISASADQHHARRGNGSSSRSSDRNAGCRSGAATVELNIRRRRWCSRRTS